MDQQIKETAIPKKKLIFSLPSKFYLTEKGIDYCAKNKIPVKDVITFDKRKILGFEMSQVNAKFLQKLIADNFFGGIEINSEEFVSKKHDILDITKLLIYGILYKKFKPTLNNILFNSSIIKKFNRNNPKSQISKNFTFKKEVIKTFTEENAKIIRALKSSLIFEPFSIIQNDKNMNADQKNEKRNIVQKFIDMVNDETWFLFSFVTKSDDKLDIMKNISNVLISFLKKTQIADYLALILLELIENAEKAHYQNLASHDNTTRGDVTRINEMLRDKAFRDKLIERAKQKEIYINLAYKFDSEMDELGNRIKLQISVINNGYIDDNTKKNIQKKTNTSVKEKSLAQFYNEANAHNLGAGLGLYYLSYLEKACNEEDIIFESRVSSDQSKNKTEMVLFLYI